MLAKQANKKALFNTKHMLLHQGDTIKGLIC